ncbi:tandem-95 repeat protein [Acuticoccus sp. MNP-M23]|uniref:tandem-95 repeat protein n=1 Tax=Acuticoccus sp. MNP-M23 TaxID=3072793 RepID=UPI0028166F1C|nr:tandem-95 repeat protein [Acuticoccus sp. MNP-M23]WMS43959.1 tandem-95 repeat protein [Acuticoccus sp. MNP-M23]
MSDSVSLLTGKDFAPLETAGNKIVDQDGEAVFIKAINWYGMELESFGVPAGVDQRSVADIMQSVADLGFNTLRLPVSTLAVLDPYEVAPWFGIDFTKNPELEGATSLEVLEHVIDEAAKVGLSVIVDNHNISSEGWEGRWYDADYTEAEWVEMWETLAATLGDKANVIGADLRNEPFDAAWDNWSTAAETAGNAIHAVDGDWLVIVEGVHHSMDGDWYQWAGNLKDAHVDPIVLNQDNKLVYSVHEYPDPVATKLELTPGSTYYSLFDEYWGSISLELGAPVFVGEFGFRNDSADDGWTEALSNYFRGDTDGDGVIDEGGSPIAGFAYWSLNPPEDLGHNLFAEDFVTVRQEVWADLEPLVNFTPDWVGAVPDVSDNAPDPDPEPDPVTTLENAFGLELIVNSDWGNGASITVQLTNTSGTAVPMESIVVSLDAPRDFSVVPGQIWRALVDDANPDAPTFRLIAQGDGVLDPGESADFLFVASYDGTWNVTTLGATADDLFVVDADLPVSSNAPPEAADLARDGVEDTALTIDGTDILAGASDADGDALSIAAVGNPQNGTAALVAGNIVYTPDADFAGTDTFTYTVDDGAGGTATGTITVTVAGVNDAPMANDIAFTLDEDGSHLITNAELQALGADPDGDVLNFNIGDGPTLGALTWTAEGLLYTPDADLSGPDVFTLAVSDGEFSATSTIGMTVRPVNDAPTLTGFAIELDEDTTHRIPLADILDRASDVDGDILTVTAVAATNGTATLGADGIVYTPHADFAGIDQIAVTISDGAGGTANAEVSVSVRPVNDAPVAGDTAFTAEAGSAVRIDIAALLAAGSDADGDTLALTGFGTGANGTLVQEGDALVYTPADGFTGTDTIAYTVSDGQGGTATGDIVLTVGPAPEEPEPGALSFEIVQENDWGNGAFYSVAYTNTGETAIDYADLTISFDPGQAVTIGDGQVWDGIHSGGSGNSVNFTVTPNDSDGVLSAGETHTFGFVLSYAGTWNESELGATGDSFSAAIDGAADDAPQPSALDLDFALSRVDDWGTGAAVTLDVTNEGEAAISFDDFAIAYDGDRDVAVRDEIYEAAILSADADRPVFSLAPSDGSVALGAGQTRSFVFLADYDGTYGTEGLGVSLDDFSAIGTDLPFG